MIILILTAHFPSYDCPNKSYATPFLYNYAVEWVRMGHEVHIIHYCRKYPRVFNVLANTLARFGYTKYKRFVVDSEAQTNKDYEYDGIRIYRRNYMKVIPHKRLGRFGVNRLIRVTRDLLSNIQINPGFIIGDCVDPVLHMFDSLPVFEGCKKYQIIHDSDIKLLNDISLKRIFSSLDCILLRSKKQLTPLESIVGKFEYRFFYSGIPDDVLLKGSRARNRIKKLLYVGALYKSKGLETILVALSELEKSDYQLTIVGDGVDRSYFKKRVSELGIESTVCFIGKVDHELVFDYMKDADALLLISKETFGMVYVEAMSQGCIPIAARNEGIDGVVKNGENGYLIPLDDPETLASLLLQLQTESGDIISMMSENALKTAREMTNTNLAKGFINYHCSSYQGELV